MNGVVEDSGTLQPASITDTQRLRLALNSNPGPQAPENWRSRIPLCTHTENARQLPAKQLI